MTIEQNFVVDYDGESGGPFFEGELLTFSGGAVARLEILRDAGTEGKLYVSIHSGSTPADNETITGGTSAATASVNGTPFASRFPLKIRDDTSYNSTTQAIRWTGGTLGATHSCLYDGEVSGPFVVGETISFANGAKGELIQLTDNGTSGELFMRMLNTVAVVDNEVITGGTSGATAAVDGNLESRIYQPIEIHYWLRDLGDDSTSIGDDDHDRTKARPTDRVFTTIINARGNCNIDDDLSYRMYGGSWSQNGGDDAWGGLDIGVVDNDGSTEPILIQNNAIRSDTTGEYWKNFYGGNAASRVRLMVKYRSGGVDIDRRAIRGRALELGDTYFTPPEVTLGVGISSLSLSTNPDGNNQTSAGTISTWTDVALATGYATIDHDNGNGAQPYWGVLALGSRTKNQAHERLKWVQRRGTSETIFGLNAALFVGNDLDVPYDTEASGPFTEGETLTFGGGGTALLLALDDQGTTGTLYCQRLTGDAPVDGETITGGTSSATAAVNGTPSTRLITNNLFGVFTGTGFNPTNQGLTLEATDANNSDLFVDLMGANQQPPNNQQGIVNTDASNTVCLYPYDGSSVDAAGEPEPDFDYLSLNTTLSGASETSVVVTTSIPSWVPVSGWLRITTDAGVRKLVPYTAKSGSTFTIPSTDFSGDNATAGNGVMPAPLDGVGETSFTGVYTSAQLMTYLVLNGSGAVPKEPQFGTVTFGTGGFAINVNLSDDL